MCTIHPRIYLYKNYTLASYDTCGVTYMFIICAELLILHGDDIDLMRGDDLQC